MQSSTPAERHRLALTAMHMLPSCVRTHSASTTLALSGLTCCTLHDSCLRFEHDVTGALARLGSHLPATALVTKDLHLHVKHQLYPAHSLSTRKHDKPSFSGLIAFQLYLSQSATFCDKPISQWERGAEGTLTRPRPR